MYKPRGDGERQGGAYGYEQAWGEPQGARGPRPYDKRAMTHAGEPGGGGFGGSGFSEGEIDSGHGALEAFAPRRAVGAASEMRREVAPPIFGERLPETGRTRRAGGLRRRRA